MYKVEVLTKVLVRYLQNPDKLFCSSSIVLTPIFLYSDPLVLYLSLFYNKTQQILLKYKTFSKRFKMAASINLRSCKNFIPSCKKISEN